MDRGKNMIRTFTLLIGLTSALSACDQTPAPGYAYGPASTYNDIYEEPGYGELGFYGGDFGYDGRHDHDFDHDHGSFHMNGGREGGFGGGHGGGFGGGHGGGHGR